MTYGRLIEAWPEITCDLHERYGIDLSDDELMRARSWPWLRTRIDGVFQVRSRALWAVLNEDERDAVNDRLIHGGHPLPWC